MSNVRKLLPLILLSATVGILAPGPAEGHQAANGVSATLISDDAADRVNLLSGPAGLSVADVSLSEALDALEAGSGVSVAYSPTLLPSHHRVTCECQEASVQEAVSILLEDTAFGFTVVGGQLVIRQARPPVAPSPATLLVERPATVEPSLSVEPLRVQPRVPEEGTIVGTVVDAATSSPLNAVQVFLTEMELGALTGQSGTFTIRNVPAGTHLLRAERIGYGSVTEEVTVEAGATVRVELRLAREALGLDEVVVTGTAGAARRREIGNAITQINVADLADRPIQVSDMLQSTAAGIEVNQLGGGETGQGVRIRLRGQNSINQDRDPIIFIDGVRMMENQFDQVSSPDFRGGRGANNMPSVLNSLNPNDIERIEVIKGSAASTLYGTEASNGVIQIFTKRGTSSAPVWTVETQQGTMWMQRFGIEGESDFVKPDGTPPEVTNPKYLWMDPWICTGPFRCGDRAQQARTHDYSLSVRGGSSAIQYFASGGLAQEKGNLPNDALERWNVRGNFTMNPLPGLSLQWNTAYSNNWQQNTPVGNNAQGLTLNVFRGEEHNNQTYLGAVGNETLHSILDFDIQQDVERFTTGGTVTFSPLTNLTNRLTIGYDYSNQETRGIRPFGFILWPQGGISVQSYTRRYLTFDYVGTYSFDIVPDLRSSFSWGGQAVGDREARIEAWGEGFPGAAEPTVSSASSTLGFETRQAIWNAGFFFQNVFDLQDKYFLTVGLRVDGNSTFGSGFGLQTYPKVSGSYVISDEDFWRPGWGDVKLRAAYGLSGRAPDALVQRRTWQNIGLGGDPAFIPDNLGNPDIGPEVTAERELGFDGSWFNNRLSASFTHYKQITSDAIQARPSLPSVGFTQSVEHNIGKVENLGTESTLNFEVVRSRDWGWDLGLNLSTNRNRVLEWEGNPDHERVGRPISYRTWTMFVNPMGMGTAERADGTYSVETCTVMIDGEEVPRPGLDPEVHACTQSSTLVYGYPSNQWPRIISGSTGLRLPYGIELSARGEFRSGRYLNYSPVDINRSVRSPWCYPYYAESTGTRLKPETPGVFVHRCTPGLGGRGHAENRRDDFFKLRSVAATIPMEFAFPEQVQAASMTIVLGNVYTWSHSPWGVNGVDGELDRRHRETIPPPTTLRASLRLTF